MRAQLWLLAPQELADVDGKPVHLDVAQVTDVRCQRADAGLWL
jgi:hypothetical protein